MATEKIESAVEAARKAHRDAMDRYVREEVNLQRKASVSIDLFGGNATSRVAEIVTLSRKMCDDLYAACQAQVYLLDETCRPLLNDDVPPALVREVWQTICKLNEESEIANNFTASLNSEQLGNMATVQYHPSINAKMIQSYWEAKYQNCPGRETLEKEEKLAAEQKAQKEKEIANQKNAAAEAAYKQAKQEWDAVYEEIRKKREADVLAGIEKERPCLEKRIKDKYELDQRIQKQMLGEYRQAWNEAEAEIGSLRFYQLGRRKELERILAELPDKISAAEQALVLSEKRYREQIGNIDKTLQSNRGRLQEEANKKYPLPRKPRKPVHMMYDKPTPTQLVTEAIKPEIIETLVKHGSLSYAQLSEKCSMVADLPTGRITACLRELEREGEIRIVKKKTESTYLNYYELAY